MVVKFIEGVVMVTLVW